MDKTITWVEIPAIDFQRAVQFYETIFGEKLKIKEMGGNPYALLPHSQEGVGGAITQWPGFQPAENGAGVVVYLNTNGKLDEMLEKVTSAGGKISTPKAKIDDQWGHYATILDTEGNKVALHQPG